MKVKDPTSETAIKLIQSATELFNDFGYTGTSINDIAKKSKLSKGILYHYFQSKDDVYLFCLSECINNFVDFMERNISKISLSKETMIRVVELRFVFSMKIHNIRICFTTSYPVNQHTFQKKYQKYDRF